MDSEQKKQAMIISLRLLAATPKSRGDLMRKLAEKGLDAGIVEETLSELEQKGLLSDRAFAQNLIGKLTAQKPSGIRKIRFELKRKGVPEPILRESLKQITPEDETQRARELCVDRWERFKALPPLKRRKKVCDFLIRRGFEFQLVNDLLEEFE